MFVCVEFMVITTDFACFGEACVFWLEQKYGSDSQIRAVYSTDNHRGA